MRLAYVVTSALSARALLRGQLAFMTTQGFDVSLLCAPDPSLVAIGEREGVRVLPVSMSREMAPLKDLLGLARLTATLASLRPDIVNASTPKAGLLGMMAARALSVPARFYVLRGLRLETTTGLQRSVLRATERISVACATDVICVSNSLRARFSALGLGGVEKLSVLGDGSSNGVDADRLIDVSHEKVEGLRTALGIPSAAPIIGFVGRLTRDKGLEDLSTAFARVRSTRPETRLVIVGGEEAGDPPSEASLQRLKADPNVFFVGEQNDVRPYYGLMDVLAFPSYREGFPNVPLEAAAWSVPTVGYRATGTVDAVIHGETGLLTSVADQDGFAQLLERYLANPSLRRSHGANARERAQTAFSPIGVWSAVAEAYRVSAASRP